MTDEKTLLEDVIDDINYSKKIIADKRQEIAKINTDIKYYEGVHDGANNILQMIKKYIEVKK